MPTRPSAKKRLRQSQERRTRNRAVKSEIRTQIRKVRSAVADGDAETCEAQFRLACKKLDQAAAKNVIHRNAASRTKSRLSAAIKTLKAS